MAEEKKNMGSNEKYQEYIIPKLQEFWKDHKEDYVNSGLKNGLFFPHVFDGYDACDKKIFYIGQDAPYWLSKEQMIKSFDAGDYGQYLRKNNEVLLPLEKRLAWGNSPAAFWTMVNKLHLYLLTGEWKQDITKISKVEAKLLETVGYSNISYVPIMKTIVNYGDWDKIDPDKYVATLKALFPVEQLQGVVSSFDPDLVIVLTNFVNELTAINFLKGLDISWTALYDDVEPNVHVGVFEYNSRKRKIVWTSNPNRYRFIGTNMYEASALIKKAIELS